MCIFVVLNMVINSSSCYDKIDYFPPETPKYCLPLGPHLDKEESHECCDEDFCNAHLKPLLLRATISFEGKPYSLCC